jgi:hypothetical protein
VRKVKVCDAVGDVFWRWGQPFRDMIPFGLRLKLHQLKEWMEIRPWLVEAERHTLDADSRLIVRYLKKSPFRYRMIPYAFTEAYHPRNVQVFRDRARGLNYVLWQGRRLYFPGNFTEFRIKMAYVTLLLEQDQASPHRYEKSPGGGVRDGDAVLDAGASEGFFALTVVERTRSVILVEKEDEWREPLMATFEPFAGKIEIVRRHISDRSTAETVTLDDVVRRYGSFDFVKADIEGHERAMIRGGVQSLSAARDMRLAICTYHRRNDAVEIEKQLAGLGFQTSFSPGWIVSKDYDDGMFGLSRGVCYAEKPLTGEDVGIRA